jgi:hypothetical protein
MDPLRRLDGRSTLGMLVEPWDTTAYDGIIPSSLYVCITSLLQ